MGALHEGHLALVRQARKSHDRVVCSIFINPLQFNNPEDLAQYPHLPEQDRDMLDSAGCHALFTPAKEALFDGFVPMGYDLGGLDRFWEGPSRPGHFQGVVNVVERLFSFLRPDAAFFGEKDRQQLTIIQHVARAAHWPVEIVPCPTVRSEDGLALSSRNLRLSAEERQNALALYRSLRTTAELSFRVSVDEAVVAGRAVLHASPGVEVDYFGAAHPRSLIPLDSWDGLNEAVALVAAQVGPVRLIDNITLRRR